MLANRGNLFTRQSAQAVHKYRYFVIALAIVLILCGVLLCSLVAVINIAPDQGYTIVIPVLACGIVFWCGGCCCLRLGCQAVRTRPRGSLKGAALDTSWRSASSRSHTPTTETPMSSKGPMELLPTLEEEEEPCTPRPLDQVDSRCTVP